MQHNGIGKRLAMAAMVVGLSVSPVMGGTADSDAVSGASSFIEQFDANGDGLVSVSEFPGDETMFTSLDVDGSEYIDESEAPQGGPPPHGRPDPEAMIEEFDSDGDGRLSSAEFPGPADHFDRLDTDADELLSADELQADRPGPGPAGKDGFANDDADQDGYVTRAEFSGPEELFDQLDADGDGSISKAEAKAVPPPDGPFADSGTDQ